MFPVLNYNLKFKIAMNDQQIYYSRKLQYEIDAWDLSVLWSEGAQVQVIDARSAEAFEKEHIPGAISLPHRLMTESSTSRFDRETLFVVYCDGIGCNASTKGALNMSKLGFNVKELIGGLDWWKRDGYQTKGSGATDQNTVACGC
jgi:rhodanese-related sulfurtransferase